MELLAQHLDQRVDGVVGEVDILSQRFLGAQHEQPLADRRHHTLQQYAVDAQRVGERLAQPARRLDVQRQRAIAALQVEIDQRNAPALAVGEIPGRG